MITICVLCGPIEVECDACAQALRDLLDGPASEPPPDPLPWPEERGWRP